MLTTLESTAPVDQLQSAYFLQRSLECTADVASWMRSNRLQLNSDKTEVLWCTTGRRQHQLPTAALLIDGALVSPMSPDRDLGVYIDADL